MVVKPGIAIVALPASGRGRNGPLFCRCSDRELRSRPASKGAVRRHPGRALALRLQRQRTLRGRSAVRPAVSKKSRDPLLPRRAGRSTALFAQPSFSDSTVIARTSRRCRIVRRAAASLRLPPRRQCRSELERARPAPGACIHAEAEARVQTDLGASRAGRAHAQLRHDRIVGVVLLAFRSGSHVILV